MKTNIRFFVLFLALLTLINSATSFARLNGPALIINFNEFKGGSTFSSNYYLERGIIFKPTRGEKLVISRDPDFKGVYVTGTGNLILKFVEPGNKNSPVVVKRAMAVTLAINVLPRVSQKGTRVKQYNHEGKLLWSEPMDDGGVFWMVPGCHSVLLDFNGNNREGRINLATTYWHRGDFILPPLTLLP